MANLDIDEIWRQIPPEEKLMLLSRAHGQGIGASIGIIILGATLAVGLQIELLLWLSLLASPLVFHASAGKAWRSLRPSTILRYLAARSAARRYAFAAKSEDLQAELLFRGNLEDIRMQDEISAQLENAMSSNEEAEVWIALFPDAIVVMAERPGGADLKLGRVLDAELKIEGYSASGKEYSSDREIHLRFNDRRGAEQHYRLTSPFPAALVVCEKKMLAGQAKVIAREEERIKLQQSLGFTLQDLEDAN